MPEPAHDRPWRKLGKDVIRYGHKLPLGVVRKVVRKRQSEPFQNLVDCGAPQRRIGLRAQGVERAQAQHAARIDLVGVADQVLDLGHADHRRARADGWRGGGPRLWRGRALGSQKCLRHPHPSRAPRDHLLERGVRFRAGPFQEVQQAVEPARWARCRSPRPGARGRARPRAPQQPAGNHAPTGRSPDRAGADPPHRARRGSAMDRGRARLARRPRSNPRGSEARPLAPAPPACPRSGSTRAGRKHRACLAVGGKCREEIGVVPGVMGPRPAPQRPQVVHQARAARRHPCHTIRPSPILPGSGGKGLGHLRTVRRRDPRRDATLSCGAQQRPRPPNPPSPWHPPCPAWRRPSPHSPGRMRETPPCRAAPSVRIRARTSDASPRSTPL
jgi:hypothetical protein